MDTGNDDRITIRNELSNMSFEDILKLKEELGGKVYNDAVFGPTKTIETDFKRANKNRPRETSSKIPNARFINNAEVKKGPRDPRFDHLCGSFNEKAFKNAYSFINDIRISEKDQLKRELKTETDPSRQEKIKYLIQRMENQDREEQRQKLETEKNIMKHKEEIELLNKGIKPWHQNKAEERTLKLVSKFEELKKKGQVRKFIEKRRLKCLRKDRKRFSATRSEFS